jgi:transposase
MSETSRFVAFDVHKSYVLVAALDATLQVVLAPRRVRLDELQEWACQALRPTDRVVLEATSNAWTLYDLLAPLVAEVQVAHPLLVKLISSARVKTDTRDTLHLARLLAANLIPTVWVPPPPVRELRALVAHRERLVRQRTQAKNRVQSLLQSHNLVPPDHEAGWQQLPLAPLDRFRLQQDRVLVEQLGELIRQVDAELTHLSVEERWASPMLYLRQLPGLGIITSMTILAAIGEITRFPSPQKLVGYSGLGASVHASGQTFRTGAITKQGRRELRTALIEAAWIAVRHHPYWQAQFERLAERKGAGKAIVAIARRLLVAIWHVLTKQVADRHADPVRVARKLWRWAQKHGTASRLGLPRLTFVRTYLDRLQLGQELTMLEAGSTTYTLPPSQMSSA